MAVTSPFDIIADLDTPVSAFLKLRKLQPQFLLESVERGERLARYSFLGFGDAVKVHVVPVPSVLPTTANGACGTPWW